MGMKLEPPVNGNYAATIVTINKINILDNCDNVVGTPLLGFQSIVGKDTQPGDVGVVFTAETQLSEPYARFNNLHRHGNLNEDQGRKGYLEDNRRVKALKFRGHRSDALFMPLDSLGWTGVDVTQFKPGDSFDRLAGHEVCRKYVVKRNSMAHARTHAVRDNVFNRVDERMLPQHFETGNFFRNQDAIPAGSHVTVTQKLHGTSLRVGNVIVKRKPRLRDRVIARLLGVQLQTTTFDNISGSRKVIKDPNNPYQKHYYSTDIWSENGAKLNGVIPENYVIYGELVGWTPDCQPIQKDYTYQVPEGTCVLYVYRVAIINGQGRTTDLAWGQVKEFCDELGLKHVPELWSGPIEDFEPDIFQDTQFSRWPNWSHAVPLAQGSPCDEGVCVRVDGLTPLILKVKSPMFLLHETKQLDKEVFDMETEQAEQEAA